MDFWNGRPEVRGIEVSFFTPQVGETAEELLTAEMRRKAVATLSALAPRCRKRVLNPYILDAYLNPPPNPSECIFARVTECFSPDLETSLRPASSEATPTAANAAASGPSLFTPWANGGFPSG